MAEQEEVERWRKVSYSLVEPKKYIIKIILDTDSGGFKGWIFFPGRFPSYNSINFSLYVFLMLIFLNYVSKKKK